MKQQPDTMESNYQKLDCTVEPVYNNHPRDPQIVTVVDYVMVVVVIKAQYGIFNGGLFRNLVAVATWSLDQV